MGPTRISRPSRRELDPSEYGFARVGVVGAKGEVPDRIDTRFRDDGSRQFKLPHCDPIEKHGGCVHCVQADSSPVTNKATGQPRPRCCTRATIVFTREELALYQDVAFGESDWFTKWNARDRIQRSLRVIQEFGP